MNDLIKRTMIIYPSAKRFHGSLLVFRVLHPLQLMIVQGLKKMGIGVTYTEQVPNSFHQPEVLNQIFAIAANLFFPLLVIAGLFTRLAVVPILMVTISDYFIVHWHDPLPGKDIPLCIA